MASYNVPFYTRQEATAPPLAEEEMRLMQIARVIQDICFVLCLAVPLALGAYATYAITRPQWKVNPAELTALEKTISQHNARRGWYATTINRLNRRVRMDLVASRVLLPPPKGIFLESVDYKTEYEDAAPMGMLTASGYSVEPDASLAESYAAGLAQALGASLTGFEVSTTVTEQSLDPKSGNLKFVIRGVIK